MPRTIATAGAWPTEGKPDEQTKRSVPGQRYVAAGVVERHARACASIRGHEPGADASRVHGPCACRRAREPAQCLQDVLDAGGGVLVDRRGQAPRPQRRAPRATPRAPTLGQAAPDFLARARSGRTLNRSGRRYAATTITNYETALRGSMSTRSSSERFGVALEDLPADAIDTRTLQAMVNHLTSANSAAVARQAEAALSAVLRDLYAREVLDAARTAPRSPRHPRGAPGCFRSKRRTDCSPPPSSTTRARGGLSWLRSSRCWSRPAAGSARSSGSPGVLGGVDLDDRNRDDREGHDEERRGSPDGRDRAGVRRGPPASPDGDGPPRGRGARVHQRAGESRCLATAACAPGFERVAEPSAPRGSASTCFAIPRAHGSAAGESATDIAARLGHADAAFTLRRYVHADRERLAEAPAALAVLPPAGAGAGQPPAVMDRSVQRPPRGDERDAGRAGGDSGVVRAAGAPADLRVEHRCLLGGIV